MNAPLNLPGEAHLGKKVSVRLHATQPDQETSRPGFRDILGILETPTSIRKKSGELVHFNPSEIALWKLVENTETSTGLSLFNTQNNSVEEIFARVGKRVHIYCCGPTVYRDAHLGNLRTFLLPDLISRILEFDGFKPVIVQNITDVGHMSEDFQEDKMLGEAKKTSRDPFEIAREFEDKFFADQKALNIAPAQTSPRASESISLMQEMIAALIASENAYVGDDGSVYFSAESFDQYGAVSGNKLDALKPGYRYEYSDEGGKRFHADWALWKSAGERKSMIWNSPWGEGFPGWHIECSAMSMHYLDSRVDLHIGGIDLRFPHHENERAQSNAIAHREVVHHWLHGEHLLFEGKKMAKSSENVILVKDVIDKGYDPLSVRLTFMETRYRKQMDLTWEALKAADTTLKRWRLKISQWSSSEVDVSKECEEILAIIRKDLDLPRAIVKLRSIERDESIPTENRRAIFLQLDRILGLDLARE
jgi:cysteinyl-tRNA synthetase